MRACKPKMLTTPINVHTIQPNPIFEKCLNETEPRTECEGQREGWEELDSYVLHCLEGVSRTFDNVMAQWLQSELKSKQTVESFQASKLQPDIIIMFSQWAKDLARLGGGLGWGGLGKEGKGRGQLAGGTRGHTERDDGWPLSSPSVQGEIHLPMGAAHCNVLIIQGMAFQSLPAGKYHRELPWDNI